VTVRVLHVAEPPARYHVRPPLVVDCSVVAAAVFLEEEQDIAHGHILKSELHAPYLLQCEIANVALKKLRQGFENESREGLQRALEMSIDLHRIEVQEVAALANEFRLSAYDASYLWLAGDLHVPLVTFDPRLAAAARQYLAKLP
jgi:predicted nucleic acid-binding protein